MKVVVEGSYRRRVTKKFGPLKSERWEEERFKWEQDSHSQKPTAYTSITAGLELGSEENGDRVFVRANIRNRPFLLGDGKIGEQKVTQFSVLSVAGVEVGGRISYIPEKLDAAK